MKQSGYRTIFHIYLIFFLSLLGAVLLAAYLVSPMVFVKTPSGERVKSDWPKTVTEEFQKQIIPM